MEENCEWFPYYQEQDKDITAEEYESSVEPSAALWDTVDLISLQLKQCSVLESEDTEAESSSCVQKQNSIMDNLYDFVMRYPPTKTQFCDLVRLLRLCSVEENFDFLQSLPLCLSTYRKGCRVEVKDVEDNSSDEEILPRKRGRETKKYLSAKMNVATKLRTVNYCLCLSIMYNLKLQATITVGKENVPFWHFDLFDVLGEILLTDHILQWDFKETEVGSNRGELWFGLWWKNAQRVANEIKGRKLLCIILYTDGVVVDWAGKINLCPIMMTLGNFDLQHQRRVQGKRLLGFIPQFGAHELAGMIDGNASSAALAVARRKILHDCMDM